MRWIKDATKAKAESRVRISSELEVKPTEVGREAGNRLSELQLSYYHLYLQNCQVQVKRDSYGVFIRFKVIESQTGFKGAGSTASKKHFTFHINLIDENLYRKI